MKSKQIFTFIITVLLLCGALIPAVQAVNEPVGGGTDAVVLTGFDEPDRTDAVAFALGTSQEQLSDWFAGYYGGFTGYDVQGNIYDVGTDTWCVENVDTGKVGLYYAYAFPNLGKEYTLTDGVSQPRQLCAVTIQTPGEPDINCCVAGRGFLHFPWVLSTEQQGQLDAFAVWLRRDGGEWKSLDDGFLFVSDGLQLSQRIFEKGSAYELKVTYPGGQTGVLSFQYDGELSIIDYSGGDRDGGDVSGNGSGAGIQPAPSSPQTPGDSHENDDESTPTQENSLPASNETPPQADPVSDKPISEAPSTLTESVPEPEQTAAPMSEAKAGISVHAVRIQSTAQKQGNTEAVHRSKPFAATPTETDSISQNTAPTVQEVYSPTQTVISGLRLRDFCADGESVVFGSGNLTVSIPSSLLLALNLSDSDTLSVRLTQPESNQILLAVEDVGKSVTELPGTVLRLRYMPQSESAKITVRNEAGEQITDVSYDGEILHFTVDTAGTYTILEVPKAQEAQKDVSPLIPVSGGLILAAGGITLFGRKRLG